LAAHLATLLPLCAMLTDWEVLATACDNPAMGIPERRAEDGKFDDRQASCPSGRSLQNVAEQTREGWHPMHGSDRGKSETVS
jgi:hypothetical protein